MEQPRGDASTRPTATIVVLCLLPLVVHVAANLLGGYGYFRDELYYIACAKRLGAGYVDHPPFSIWLLALVRLLIGDSVFALRLVPAVTSALSVALVCGLVLKMRGGRAALIVAALAFACSGQLLGYHTFYSMNSLDILFWLVAAYLLVGLVEEPTTRRWLLLGLVLGLGLLNKTSVLWLGAGIAAALLLTDLRPQLKTRGPWLAGATALVVFSPFVLYGIAMAIGLLVYLWARRIAPPSVDTGDKRMPYVGGEAWEPQVYQPSYQFFYVAIFFTLAHVAALVIATAPPSASLPATLGYLVIIAVAVMVLRWEQ